MTGKTDSRQHRLTGRARLLRASAWLLAVLLSLPPLLAACLWIGSHLVSLPEALLQPSPEALVLEDRSGRDIAVFATGRARDAEAVTLEEAGTWLPQVTVALEDRRFWTHGGVDWVSVGGSAWRNLGSLRIVSGGATISQQLVKLTRGRSGWRWSDKAVEAMVAIRLTREWPRERILAEYLNRIDYGNRRLGSRAAARAYFGKEPAKLTLGEAIFLAGLPQAPTRLNPWRRPEAAATRWRLCVRMLAERGILSAAEVDALGAQPPPLCVEPPPAEARAFAELAAMRAGAFRGRLRTTLDLELQRKVQAHADAHVARLRHRGVGQTAVVILDNEDGSVRALVGSVEEGGTGADFNAALLPRSCGSTLKPFLYLEAIERGLLTAASLVPDTPDAVRSEYIDYDPHNFDERHHGPVRVREALGSSLNVPAVHTLGLVGARAFMAKLNQWGLRFPRDLRTYGAGLILGNAEPRLIDLAAAYAGLADGGSVPEWRVLAAEPSRRTRAASPASCSIVADMLCDDEARRLSFGRGSPLAVPARVPCKTGTSSGFRDAWAIGFTARHTVAVWAGNIDGNPMEGVASVEAAAPLWRALVNELLPRDGGIPEPDRSASAGSLESADVCRLTGLRPSPSSPGILREWFLPGTAPDTDASTMLRSHDQGIRLVLPSSYRTWCAGPYNLLGAQCADPTRPVILFPHDGATFILDPALPRTQQHLSFLAAAPVGSTLRWTLNGADLPSSDSRADWALQSGDWTLRLATGQESVEVHFRVLEKP